MTEEELIDRAYDVMCAELRNWQIIGPLADKRQDFFRAIRIPAAETYAGGITVAEETTRAENFTSKQYAVAYVQWNGLKAVLADKEIRAALAAPDARLAPPVNED